MVNIILLVGCSLGSVALLLLLDGRLPWKIA